MPIVIGYKLQESIKGIRRQFRQINKEVLQETAGYWHSDILPSHFGPGNRSRYQHEPRAPLYIDVIKKQTGKGQGKYVDQLLSGRSRRFMMADHKITGTSRKATLIMNPPRYFTNPFIGSFRDEHGKIKRITNQPDKVKEITRIDTRDRLKLQKFMGPRLESRIKAVRETRTTVAK